MKKLRITFGSGENQDVPIVPMPGIQRLTLTTKNGNTLQVFYNPETNLVVIDLLAKNGNGGNELLRRTLDEEKLLAHTK